MAAYKYLKHTASEVDAAVDSQREHCEASDLHVCAEDKAALANCCSDVAALKQATQENVDDITVIKNNTAINQSMLGGQRKNLLQNKAVNNSLHNVKFVVNADGSVTISTTDAASETATLTVATNMVLQPGAYILSGASELGSKGDLRVYVNGEVKTGKFTITETTITNVRIFIYKDAALTGEKTVYPMIRYADITDSTYEPYTPSLQDQINALTARIAALETAAVSTTSTSEPTE